MFCNTLISTFQEFLAASSKVNWAYYQRNVLFSQHWMLPEYQTAGFQAEDFSESVNHHQLMSSAVVGALFKITDMSFIRSSL